MVFHKVQKAIAIATMASLVATSAPIPNYIKVIEANAKATVEDNISKDDEGVYKVTMDETGYLTADAQYDPEGTLAGNENTPFSWDNVNMYFVLTDRFYNGDKSNDHSYGRSANSSNVSAIKDSANKEDAAKTFQEVAGSYASKGESQSGNYESNIGTFHGGDLAGLTSYVENGYFDALGTDAIWISAPYEQVHGAVSSEGFKHYAYHGYYALDYTEVDANMGTAEELHKFIDTAHEHGIRVVFDVVMNHTGYPDAYTIAEYYGADSKLLTSNWRDIYFGTEASQLHWYHDYANESASGGNGNFNYCDEWNSSYYGTPWLRMVQGRYGSGYTASESGDEVTYCSAGLPDFKTESGEKLGIPDILSKKWKKEGRLSEKTAETKAMLKACGYGDTATVKEYLVAWLANWVREYGVDGFRCDTAKHVKIDCWKDLKTQCSKALKEWRAKNKDKACAGWSDDFWMTGEVYDQGLSMNYGGTDYSQAFNSLINFKFQGVGSKTGAGLDGTYAEYAKYARSSATGDPLSYISSHDKGIGARGANAGSALLLCPGGVQIYYGDETARKNGPGSGDQPSRSQMTWDDDACLNHWEKVGHFRRNHIAVGAGEHKKLSDSPYTFARTYKGKATVGSETKTDYEDKVVVCLPGSAGTVDVSVGDVFKDGDTVVDEYTGTEYTVSGGKVSATCDGNGVILLAEPTVSGPKAKVMTAVTKGKESGGVYNTDSLSLKLSVQNVKDATYQVNDLTPVELKESAEITIGEDTAYEEKTTITIKGTSEIDGTAVEKTFTYSRGKEPVIGADDEGFTLRIKKSDFTSAPSIWVWSGKTNYCTNIWPGDTLKEDGDFYVYSNAKITGEANFIISHGTSYRNTKEGETELSAKGSVLFDKATNKTEEYAVQTGDPCKVTVEYLDGSGNVIKTITRVGAEGDTYTVYAPEYLSTVVGAKLAEGEETSKTGTFTTKGETVQFNYSVNGEVIQTPAPATTEPAPATTEPAPTEPSKKTVAPATTEPAPAPTEPSKKTVAPATTEPAPATTEPAPATTEPAPATTEPAKETVAPATTEPAQNTPMPTQDVGTIQTIAPTATPSQDIDEEFEVSISASTKSVVAGKSVKLTASAFGGNGNYQYKFVAEKSGSKSTLRSYAKTPTYTWKPTKAGKYTITVTAKDVETGTIATEDVKITVTAAPVKITKFIAKSLGKLKVQLQANATGGKSTLKYKYTYTFNKKTKTVKNYSTTKKLTTTLKKAGTYKFKLYVYDSSNKKVIKTKTVTVKVKK